MSATVQHGCADIGNDDGGWAYIECDCGAVFGGLPDFVTAVDQLLDHVAGGERVTIIGEAEPSTR